MKNGNRYESLGKLREGDRVLIDPVSTGKKITKQVAEKILENVKYANSIIFSGGEVALAYDEIKMIIDIIKEKPVVSKEREDDFFFTNSYSFKDKDFNGWALEGLTLTEIKKAKKK